MSRNNERYLHVASFYYAYMYFGFATCAENSFFVCGVKTFELTKSNFKQSIVKLNEPYYSVQSYEKNAILAEMMILILQLNANLKWPCQSKLFSIAL